MRLERDGKVPLLKQHTYNHQRFIVTNVNVDSVFVHSVRFAIPIHFNRIRVWARSGKSYMLYWAVCCLFRYDWFSIRFIIIHSILLFLILYFGLRFFLFLCFSCLSHVLSFSHSYVRLFVRSLVTVESKLHTHICYTDHRMWNKNIPQHTLNSSFECW